MQSLFQGSVGRKRNIHESLRPITAQIAYRANISVGDGNQCAAGIAHYGSPQGDVFDASDGVGDLDGVAHDVLIFEDDVKTGDEVADKILGAKTYCQAGQAGKRSDGGYIDAEL